ncbi:hypothetical protein BH160DRAFT_2810 [Burkholderia sp. H160]|nr:hypothetical protein BH160DRAFT_2810 [Burkholderia sp. H160]
MPSATPNATMPLQPKRLINHPLTVAPTAAPKKWPSYRDY